MKHEFLVVAFAVSTLCVAPSVSAGKKGSGAVAPGTGSKTNSTYVDGYVTKDGKFVEGHQRSTPDAKFENNLTTKCNKNLYKSKDGTSVTPPTKK